MAIEEALDRFAQGTGRKIPPPPFRHERAAEVEAPQRPRRRQNTEEVEPVYVEQPAAGQGCAGFVLNSLFLVAVLFVLSLFAWWAMSTGRLDTPAVSAPMSTAGITIATQRPFPTSPPAQEEDKPAEARPAVAAPTSNHEAAIAAYNAEQQARATALQATQEGPGQAGAAPADSEAQINAWLAAPVSTATPLPEPDEPGFVASFQDAPECSPFVGYLPGSECHALAQTATAGE